MAYNWNNYNRPKKKNRNDRPDHQPGHRVEFERNRRKILAIQEICALCGKPVDKSLKYPDPYSATVDHIIPVSRGGHPSSLDNLQLAHFRCNRRKGDKATAPQQKGGGNRQATLSDDLPLTIDWTRYRADDDGNSNFDALRAKVEVLEAKGYQLTAKGIKPRNG